MGSLSDYVKKTETEHKVGGSNGGWIKIGEDSEKKVRILTFPTTMLQHFSKGGYKGFCIGKANSCQGCEEGTKISVRHLVYAMDYDALTEKEQNPDADITVVKLFGIPHTAMSQIQALQDNPEYAFDDMPMPYDITIKRDDSGNYTKYSVLAARSNTEIPNSVLEQMPNLESTIEIVRKIREKAQG